jgi:hypothetical protein
MKMVIERKRRAGADVPEIFRKPCVRSFSTFIVQHVDECGIGIELAQHAQSAHEFLRIDQMHVQLSKLALEMSQTKTRPFRLAFCQCNSLQLENSAEL